MSLPTQPTPTTIATEAWWLYARRSPTSTEITRATSYGMELVKNDLMDLGWNWDFLRITAYIPVTQYVSTYSAPTDYKKIISVRLLDGDRSGTAQAGASTTITLAATDGGGTETAGKWIIITGGTGANQGLQCKSFNTTTKVATMETAWTTTPNSTSTYLVVDKFSPLELQTIYDRELIKYPGRQAQPTILTHLANASEGSLVLNTSPEKTTYVMEIHYYLDLLKVDTDVAVNPRYNNILRLLNGLFIQGLYTWLCQADSRYQIQRQIYEAKMAKLESMYLYPNNQSGFRTRVDY